MQMMSVFCSRNSNKKKETNTDCTISISFLFFITALDKLKQKVVHCQFN